MYPIIQCLTFYQIGRTNKSNNFDFDDSILTLRFKLYAYRLKLNEFFMLIMIFCYSCDDVSLQLAMMISSKLVMI